MIRRAAPWLLATALAVAIGADFIASDRPLVLSLDGDLYLVPNLIDHDELDGLAGEALSAALGDDDWALWPPVRHGPESVRGAGGELAVLAPPSSDHWLGTDDRGRDVAARLVHGARATLLLALFTALLALAVGTLAAILGARSRVVDRGVRGGADALAAVPALLFAVAAQGLVGAGSLLAVAALIAVPRAAEVARLCRGALASALAQPYCDAARALGVGPWRVIVRHALPQAVPALAVAAALTAATAVLAEAGLGFLGFGVPPPTASWGELLAQAGDNQLRWWLVVPTGIVVVVVAACFDALAQGAPRWRRRPRASR